MPLREELYRIANHIASAKGALPDDWQPWADEIESDLRELVSREQDKQEPVIVVGFDGGDAFSYRRLIQSFKPGTQLYAVPPAPVVPEDFDGWFERVIAPAMKINGIKAAEQKMVYRSTKLAWEASKGAPPCSRGTNAP